MRIFGALLALTLGACSSLPPAPGASLPARSSVQDFTLEGRFALQIKRAEAPSEKAAGRVYWQHDRAGGADRLRLSTPLGSGLAEVHFDKNHAVLTTADRQQRSSEDPARLLQDATGYPLPLTQLPHWLLGRPQAGETLELDEQARPSRLISPPWRVAYRYPDTSPDALPQRLDITHPEIELRLFIEQWQSP